MAEQQTEIKVPELHKIASLIKSRRAWIATLSGYFLSAAEQYGIELDSLEKVLITVIACVWIASDTMRETK